MGPSVTGDGASGSATTDNPQSIREFVEKVRNLPDDFLRIPSFAMPPELNLESLQQQSQNIVTREVPLVDMVDISVVEAQLVKNYGLLRMDLYCKIRVGHMVCETRTCINGAKNPKWDGVYQFSLRPGIDSFHLEIYDEKQFSLDEKIAWLYEPIPPEIFQGITVERWFPLSGRLGPNKEGSVLLVLSHKRVPARGSNMGRALHLPPQRPGGAPVTVFVPAANHTSNSPIIQHGPGTEPHTAYIQPQPIPPQSMEHLQQSQQPRGITEVGPPREEDVNQLSEMFPSVDKAIIKAILENNHNDKEAAISALLALG